MWVVALIWASLLANWTTSAFLSLPSTRLPGAVLTFSPSSSFSYSIQNRQQLRQLSMMHATSTTTSVAVASKSRLLASMTSQTEDSVQTQQGGKIDLLYDSECPICMMEVEFLQKRDIHQRIKFTDLSSSNYNPADHGNVTFRQGMRKLRAVLPDGNVVTGVEVFRRTYDAIGLGWMFSVTNVPFIGDIADKIYDVWAENRLRLTGRADLAEKLKEKSEALAEAEPISECDKDGCAIDWEAEAGGEASSSASWDHASGGDNPHA